jgi:hypothetical protein
MYATSTMGLDVTSGPFIALCSLQCVAQASTAFLTRCDSFKTTCTTILPFYPGLHCFSPVNVFTYCFSMLYLNIGDPSESFSLRIFGAEIGDKCILIWKTRLIISWKAKNEIEWRWMKKVLAETSPSLFRSISVTSFFLCFCYFHNCCISVLVLQCSSFYRYV